MDLIRLHGVPRRKWREMAAIEKWQPTHKYYRAGDTCPRCGEVMDDGSEYVDVGVGSVQATYLMDCYGCGLRAGNVGAEVEYFDCSELGEYIIWAPPEEAETINGRVVGI